MRISETNTIWNPSFQNTDQFYAVGLVGYGFGCEDAIPAVYTNLANSEVKRFIESAFSRNFCWHQFVLTWPILKYIHLASQKTVTITQIRELLTLVSEYRLWSYHSVTSSNPAHVLCHPCEETEGWNGFKVLKERIICCTWEQFLAHTHCPKTRCLPRNGGQMGGHKTGGCLRPFQPESEL